MADHKWYKLRGSAPYRVRPARVPDWIVASLPAERETHRYRKRPVRRGLFSIGPVFDPVEGDGWDETWQRHYFLDPARRLVLERRSESHTPDVVVWGRDLPRVVLPGAPKPTARRALASGIAGSCDGSRLTVRSVGARPFVLGLNRVEARWNGRGLRVRTEGGAVMVFRRHDGTAVAAAINRLRIAPRARPDEVAVALALLHGRWLDAARGALLAYWFLDPMDIGPPSGGSAPTG